MALYWSNSTFANASAGYDAGYVLGPSAFSDSTFDISILSNAQNFKYVQSGGVTVNSPAPSFPYPATTTAVYSGDVPADTWGTWGWQQHRGGQRSAAKLRRARWSGDAEVRRRRI